MSRKNPVSIYDLSKKYNINELVNSKKRCEIMDKLGITLRYFDKQHKDNNVYVPNNYESLWDYESDKSKAEGYILNNLKVPEDLEQRLIYAKQDLQNKGLC